MVFWWQRVTGFGDAVFQMLRVWQKAQRCWCSLVGWIIVCLAYACTLLIASWALVPVGASVLAALSVVLQMMSGSPGGDVERTATHQSRSPDGATQ
jgi:hypothetical protein